MARFKQRVSPDFGLNIRLYGAIQAEADIGSFLSKLQSNLTDALKRRALADKVYALELQKDLWIMPWMNLPADPTLNQARVN